MKTSCEPRDAWQIWATWPPRGMVRQKSGETAMASPTPSLDSLNGVLAMCGEEARDRHGLDLGYSHVFSGLGSGSSSGVSSATSSSSASSLDRASTGSASSTSGQSERTQSSQQTRCGSLKSGSPYSWKVSIILATKTTQYLINDMSYQLHEPF